MKPVRDSVVVVGMVGLAAALAACPASLDDRCANGVCDALDASDDGGADGSAAVDSGGDAAPTDSCVEDPAAPSCLSDDASFFVSGSGSDGAAGTKAAPLKTIAAALGKLTQEKKRIYVCEGTYAEDVLIEAKHAGASLFGGFACDWTKTGGKPKVGAGPTALTIKGATGIAIADLAFAAKDAIDDGGSSIAAFVANAKVTLKRVNLTAGKGKNGAADTLTPFTFPAQAELNGKNGDAPTNGAETAVICPGDVAVSTKGGKGGPNGFDGESGTFGPDNKGTVLACLADTKNGGNGLPGDSPADATGATAAGSLVEDGWRPSDGDTGKKGAAGQGGGGGGGTGGGTGGGGGAGGCGGAGGGGGHGGGGSIALASFQSNVSLETSSLTTSTAGDGGAGAAGQAGQSPAGFGGKGTTATPACNGGNGGPGGKGAAGGGGAGGVSVGVLYKGSAPVLDADTNGNITVGAKGGAGTGPGNAGVIGISAPTLEIAN